MPELKDAELLAQLIAFAPVSSVSNRPIAEFAASQMRCAGASVELLVSEDAAQLNVVASIGPSAADRSGLVLSGHLDVVPADEPGWTGEAFTLREDDGKLFGRGSCDMLGSVALFVNLFQTVDAERLTAPLVVVLTFGEELGSLGAKHLAQTWPGATRLPRACVVGEPTSLQVVRMHKGHVKMSVAVPGNAAHSGSPHLGHNAIEATLPVLEALSKLRTALEGERPANGEYFDAVPFVALNIARIHGGSALNVIPEQCVIELGLRPLPGMDSAVLISRVRSTICDAYTYGDAAIYVIDANPPMLTGSDSAVCRVLCELVGQEQSIGVSYSSDGGVFGRDLDMECVLFGPGSIEHAHRPNEFVPIAELQRAKIVLQQMIERMCMQPVVTL